MLRDLGAALIFFVSYLMMLYVATETESLSFYWIDCRIFARIAAYYLFAHVRVRVQTWLHPFADFTEIRLKFLVWNWNRRMVRTGTFTKDSHLKHQRLSWTVSLQQSAKELGGIIGICLILICIACLLMFIAVLDAELYLPFYKLIELVLQPYMAHRSF